MATDIGTGTTATFGTTGFAPQILDVNWDGIEKVVINTSHMGTTEYHTFMLGDLCDAGTIVLEIAFDPSETPPIISNGGASETVTIAAAGSANTWAATVLNSAFQFGAPLEDKMTGSLTLKVTGGITIS